MYFRGKIVGLTDKPDIRGGIIGLDFIDQVGDFHFLAHGPVTAGSI
jgi:hypothetical protein